MDVEAVVSIVIRKLTDLLIQEPIIFNKAIDEIEQVRISLRQMQSFLIDAEDKKEHEEGVKKWVDQFLAVVYEVEDAIETFVLWKMYARRMGYFFIPKNLKADSDLRNKIEEIKHKIKKLRQYGDRWGLKPRRASHDSAINFAQLDRKQDQFSIILALSYNDLPFHLRPCFLYLLLFPKDKDIPVRRLQRLWLAEGFVKHTPEKTPEDMVEIYFKELVQRNLIQIFKWRKDGSPKTCRIGVLQDDGNFMSKAQEIGLFHIQKMSEKETPQHGVRRVTDFVDPEEYISQIQNLRSYLAFDIQKNDMPATEIDRFLNKVTGQNFGLLRVVDLERVYKPKLPDNMGKLFLLLRYLGLRWTFLDALPHSVGELPYLETLDVKHTYISSLPSSIWKMKHLRHLCLNEIRLDMSLQNHGTSLTHLQTLWGLFVDKKTPVKNGLYRLINLRKLGLTCHLDSFQELDEWIARLASLQSLRIRSKNQNGQPWKLNLKPLSSLENLTNLYLLGSLPELHDRYEFPPKLTVLTLSVSKLEKDPMPILAQLPSLSVLRLLADSYTGKELKCPPKGFIKLQILKLWMLKDLETWEVGKEALKELQEVEIRCCDKLKELPAPLFILENIKKIVLTNMPQKFVDEIPAKGLIFPKTLQF
ncbi:hypothetical protein ACJW30_01G078000 [Castanea mollissima]